MKVLGIGGSSHDYAFCIVEDGEIKIAIEEERISREKHSAGPRSLAFQGLHYCLENCGITLDEIDIIVSNN